jgi:hypothetical protein
VAVAQQEFCSTILYYLLLAVAVALAAVAASVPGNQHLVQADRPDLVYMQAKMVKITPVMVVVVVEVAVAGLGVMAAQSEEVMLGAWQDRLGLVWSLAKIHLASIPGVAAISTIQVE